MNAYADGARITYAVSAHDGRDGTLTPHCAPASGTFFAVGRTRVSCAATDSAGNQAEDSFTITVIRTDHAARTRPRRIPHNPTDARATNKHGGSAAGEPPSSTATNEADSTSADNHDGAPTPSCDRTLSCSPPESAADNAKQSSNVTIDRTRPVITVPAAMTISATSKAGAKATYDVSVVDNRDGSLKASCAPGSGQVFALGTTTVICSARDSAGNGAKESFTVTVIDRTSPVITVPGPIQARAGTLNKESISYDVSATDAVDGKVSSSCTPHSGDFFALGATTVICSAKDSAGNGAKESFTVTVIDGVPPVVTVPNDIAVSAPWKTADTGATVWYDARAFDNHDGPLPRTCAPRASGSFFPLGTTTVTCSAKDSAGNNAKESFKVTVTSPRPV